MPPMTARISDARLWGTVKEYLESKGVTDWVMAQEKVGTDNHHVHLYIKDYDTNKVRCVLKKAVVRHDLTQNTNKYYSIKQDTKGKGLQYTCKDGDYIAYNGYTLDQLNEQKAIAASYARKTVPDVVTGVPTGNPIVVINKDNHREPMRTKFIKHLESLGWKRGEKFTPENSDSKQKIIEEISDELTDFWKNAFTVPEGIRMIRHAAYEFSSGEIQEFWKIQNQKIFLKNIFGQ